ncbi:glycosyltransferase family 2 protein [Salinimicrobium xinjiangense]|uniref:glycosyltransferase family 2 protein n=1 Tax=Salinimicrobium xinjiangense TaxID=438596 RepID=UPI00041B1321|nr:glycosyltransferase family A protein [Salinimicrobium xinjiangense]
MTQFSIIIPTYNSGEKIQRSIESVVNQSAGCWELIVINDGSTDDTESFILPFLSDDRIRYYYQNNSGVGHARNTGILKSRAEFIIFLDGDDILHANLLKKLISNAFSEYDILTWSMKTVVDGNEHISKPIRQNSLYKHRTSNFLAGSICYKKSLVEQVGMYDTNITFGENYELGLRICQIEDLKIKIIPEVLSTYLQGTKKRKSNTLENQFKSLVYSYRKHNELYKDNPKELSKVFYFFGYLLEKMSRYKISSRFYLKSWISRPLNVKALIKMIYLTTIK